MWRETTKDVRNLWPGGRKELNTVFIATINHLRLQHFTGSTAKAALEQDGKKKKRNMGDTRWKKGRKDVPSLSSIGGCVSRHLSCGRAIKTKQTAATHVCQFLHLIGPKD